MVYNKTKTFRPNGISIDEFKDLAELSIQKTLTLEPKVNKMDDNLFTIEFFKDSKVDILQEKDRIYIGMTAEFSKEMATPFWKILRKSYLDLIEIKNIVKSKKVEDLKLLELLIVVPLTFFGIFLLSTNFATFGAYPSLILVLIVMMIILAVIKIVNFQLQKFSYNVYILCSLFQVLTALLLTMASIITLGRLSFQAFFGYFFLYLSFAAFAEIFIGFADIFIISSFLR